jgi:hypothetical protein
MTFRPYDMYEDKTRIYQANMTRSLGELYQHMEKQLDFLTPDETIDGDTLTNEQLEIIERVEAIEEEWILDPDRRKELTLIQWTD